MYPVKKLVVDIYGFSLLMISSFAECVHERNLCAQVSYKSTQRQVNITVRKEQRGWWERLTAKERKPVFLAPDFDRWLDESDAEMEIREKVRLKLCL